MNIRFTTPAFNYKKVISLVVFLLLCINTHLLYTSFLVKAEDASASKTINADVDTNRQCYLPDEQRHFLITGIESQDKAPENVVVTRKDNKKVIVPMDKFIKNTAHYSMLCGSTVGIISATTDIFSGWEGRFYLLHGPCVLHPSPTPSTPVGGTVNGDDDIEDPNDPGITPTMTPTLTLTPSPTPTINGSVLGVSDSVTPTPQIQQASTKKSEVKGAFILPDTGPDSNFTFIAVIIMMLGATSSIAGSYLLRKR